jgi:hypothetical protein
MRLKHKPIIPPRADCEEAIFASEWELLMSHGSCNTLGCVLEHYPHKIGQREAHVVAGFICWLGSGIGKTFLNRAEYLSAVLHPRDAYLAAWAIQNRRLRQLNNGMRTLEHCVGDRCDYASVFEGQISEGKVRLPSREPTARDYEVVEHVAAWLGSKNGQDFLGRCERDCKRLSREHSLRHHLTANHGLSLAAASYVIAQHSAVAG